MSFTNKIKEAEMPTDQKPEFKQIVGIAVLEEFEQKFTEAASRWPDSYHGAIECNVNGVCIGWITYQARGANLTDIRRRVEAANCEATIFSIDRIRLSD